ncbi:MAG: type II toxin-antitoxin system PemK/MazF family toxin [Bacilli bacterium]|nr:type II toxin-antitoxin system PemK/MazF family toxin [Bacilli bacterium]
MYIPKQGDICYMNFAPTKGHEQTGLRPAVVISKDSYNKYTNLAVICPITTNTKKFPTHYELIETKKIKGSVLCEHIRSVDFKARQLSFVEKLKIKELEEIIDIINGIIEI